MIVFIAGHKSMSSRVIGYLRESSVHSKVTDDPVIFGMIMSELQAYEQHKQVRKFCVQFHKAREESYNILTKVL